MQLQECPCYCWVMTYYEPLNQSKWSFVLPIYSLHLLRASISFSLTRPLITRNGFFSHYIKPFQRLLRSPNKADKRRTLYEEDGSNKYRSATIEKD